MSGRSEGTQTGKSGRAPLRIEVVRGDITTQDTDAIVNAANNHLWMGSGVAGAIKKNGGVEIEREAVSKGPIRVGQSVWTGGGRLRARYVIHAAVMGQDLQTDADKIERATRSALETARELGVRSLSLPALGTGIGGFPVRKAAETMVRAVSSFLEESESSVQLVRFVLLGDDAYSAFRSVVESVGRRGSSSGHDY